MPVGAQVLHVHMQHGIPCIWALVDSENENEIERRVFSLRGTGHVLDDGYRTYIGTIHDGDIYVWHIFEEGKGIKQWQS